jgi:hypothetical protein
MSVVSHAAAEVATLREAVKTVRDAAEALQVASDEAQKPMLRLNLREARSILVSCCSSYTRMCTACKTAVYVGLVKGCMLWSCRRRHVGWNS